MCVRTVEPDVDNHTVMDMLHIIPHTLLRMLRTRVLDHKTSARTIVHNLVCNMSLDKEVTLRQVDVHALVEDVQVVALGVLVESCCVLLVDERDTCGAVVGAQEDVDEWTARDCGRDICVGSLLVKVGEVDGTVRSLLQLWNRWLLRCLHVWVASTWNAWVWLIGEVAAVIIQLLAISVTVLVEVVAGVVVLVCIAVVVACVLSRFGASIVVTSTTLVAGVVVGARAMWCGCIGRLISAAWLGEEGVGGCGVCGGERTWGSWRDWVGVVAVDQDLAM